MRLAWMIAALQQLMQTPDRIREYPRLIRVSSVG